MKKLLCVLLVALLVALLIFLLMTAVVTKDAALPDQEVVETAEQNDGEAYDIPIDIKDEDDETEDVEEEDVEDETNPFEGEWLCDNAAIYIDEEEGTFSVYILWDISDIKTSIWEYTCSFDSETEGLTGEGQKTNETYDEEGEVISSEVEYTDGSATFTLEGDVLIWTDAKEDIAKGLRFERGAEDEQLIEVEMEEEVEEDDADD